MALIFRCRTRFLSTLNANPDAKVDQLRRNILDRALVLVPQLGWTTRAIDKAVQEHELPSVARGLFPRGPMEIIDHMYGQMLDRFRTGIKNGDIQPYNDARTSREFYAQAGEMIQRRLELQVDHMHHWDQVISILMRPENMKHSLPLLNSLADEICVAAGDRSFDATWYSRRAAIASAYAATEIFMIRDMSPDYAESFKFSHRRMLEARGIEEGYNQCYDSIALLLKASVAAFR